MATQSADDLRLYVRTHLDVEEDEVPNSLLNYWLHEAYDRITAQLDVSPTWLHVEYAFDTEIGVQSYALDSVDGLIAPTALQSIEDLRGPNWSLNPQSHQLLRSRYRASSAPTGRPTEFSLWGRAIYLWPTPAEVQTIYVTGTRQPQDWIATNSAPDCPEEFHYLIADFALGRGYAQQDDPEMAQSFLQGWDAAVKALSIRWLDGQQQQPFIANGGLGREPWRAERASMGPLIWDWE